MEQLKTIGRELAMGSQGGFGQSKEFLELVKSISEARSLVASWRWVPKADSGNQRSSSSS